MDSIVQNIDIKTKAVAPSLHTPPGVHGLEFETLSHAGLRVSYGNTQLLCDPWLLGSCYWRSWWNYPPVPKQVVESLRPDFIYVTHLHWDHFQGPSLKLFDPEIPVIVPYDRYGRMVRDMKAVGRKNIIELRHGERFEMAPRFYLQSYHFSPFITDSAVIIRGGETVLLNANDAKLAGLPLRQIRKDHPLIDFCFRSHSSANSRACQHVIGEPDTILDDNEHYLRAFSQFIECVSPRFAIPFASNNCLLHDDVFHLNPLVQTPDKARDYFKTYAAKRGLDTQLQIMVPGDRWSADNGFQIKENDWFENRDAHLAFYRARVAPALEKQAKREASVRVSRAMLAKFFAKVSAATPFFLIKPLKGRKILFLAKSGDAMQGFSVDLANSGAVDDVAQDAFDAFEMRIELPALILAQSVTMNMFGHAAISKRVHYYSTRAATPAMDRFINILSYYECEILPLRNNFTKRSIRSLLPRWREAFLYASVLIDLKRGLDFSAIEERQLQRT